MDSFEPIGTYSSRVDDRILITRQEGPFNLPYVIAYTADLGKIATELNSTGPYATITVFSGLMTYSPDALEFLMTRARLIDSHKTFCVAAAIVALPGTRGYQTMRPVLDDFFVARGLTSGRGQVFDDLDLAHCWARSRLEVAQNIYGNRRPVASAPSEPKVHIPDYIAPGSIKLS